MSLINEARADVFSRIEPAFGVAPVDGFEFQGRVFSSRPEQFVLPCAYLGVTSGEARSGSQRGARVYVVTFPLVVLYSGRIAAQVAGLDEVIGRLVAACTAGMCVATGHSPIPPPEGAPSTAAAVQIDVDLSVYPITLKTPDLMEAASA